MTRKYTPRYDRPVRPTVPVREVDFNKYIDRKASREARNQKDKLKLLVALIVFVLIIVGIALLIRSCSADGASEGRKKSKDVDVTEQTEVKTGMEALYYYDTSRASRYDAFKAKNPSTSDGDVVWMVNVDLDKQPYEDTKENVNLDSYTMLVNKHFGLPADYYPDDMEKVDSADMRAEVAREFERLKDDASKEELYIIGQSGFRDYNTQGNIYDDYVDRDGEAEADTYSARPGHSEHQTGLTIDLNIIGPAHVTSFSGTDEAAWVLANGHNYGFIVRYLPENENVTLYMNEPWHVRYIGVEHATRMHNLGIKSFEEYWAKYINSNPQ